MRWRGPLHDLTRASLGWTSLEGGGGGRRSKERGGEVYKARGGEGRSKERGGEGRRSKERGCKEW